MKVVGSFFHALHTGKRPQHARTLVTDGCVAMVTQGTLVQHQYVHSRVTDIAHRPMYVRVTAGIDFSRTVVVAKTLMNVQRGRRVVTRSVQTLWVHTNVRAGKDTS